MSNHSHWSWRRAGIGTATLALLLNVAAVSAGPALVAAAALTATCESPTAVATAKAKPGAQHKHDPNELTPSQVQARERDLTDALRESGKMSGAAAPLATVSIPVVVHVISEDGTRAGGNIPDSLINGQINVLNQSFAGRPAVRQTAFAFQLTADQPGHQPGLVPDRLRLQHREADEGRAARGRQGHAQHLHRRAQPTICSAGPPSPSASSTATTAW